MSSFFEDFRQKFSRTRFPVHSRVAPVQPGRITRACTRASHGLIVTRIAPVLHGRTTRPCNTAVLYGCVTVCIGLEWCTVSVSLTAEGYQSAGGNADRDGAWALQLRPSLRCLLL